MKNPKKPKAPRQVSDEHDEFFKQFHRQDDRSAVILAGALIDMMLGELLRKSLLPSLKDNDPLLGERGVLASFYAKSVLSYRLGLIDDNMLRAINVIRDIRNIYAHRLEYSDLTAEPYASKISEAYTLFCWYEPFVSTAKEIFGPVENGSMQLRSTATLIAMRLKQAIDEQKAVNSTSPKTLISVKWEVSRMAQESKIVVRASGKKIT